MNIVERLSREFEFPYFKSKGQLIVKIPTGCYNVNTLSLVSEPLEQEPCDPQVYGKSLTGQDWFIGYCRRGNRNYTLAEWTGGAVKLTDIKTPAGSTVLFESNIAVLLGNNTLAAWDGKVWKVVLSNKFDDVQVTPQRFGNIFSGMWTNLGVFLDAQGCIGWFYKDGEIFKHELAPPDHVKMADGSVGWKYKDHWIMRTPEAIVDYKLGEIVGDEIYTGVDSLGRRCFVNYKSQTIRRV